MEDAVVEVRGQKWYLFGADYKNGADNGSFYFYALSFEHAEEVLIAIKGTAEIYGQIMEITEMGEDERPPVTLN